MMRDLVGSVRVEPNSCVAVCSLEMMAERNNESNMPGAEALHFLAPVFSLPGYGADFRIVLIGSWS
jgi:hypothetical protein